MADKFIVPKEQQREFTLLVKRANESINRNMAYLQREKIKRGSNTGFALLGMYQDKKKWATAKSALSTRKDQFANEQEYKQFLRHVSNWDNKSANNYHTLSGMRESYIKSITNALTKVAIDNGALTETGELPGEISESIHKLTNEQLAEFFYHGDPTDDIENQRFGSKKYFGATDEEFVDITMSRINGLKQLFPKKSKPKTKRKARKTKK